MKAILVGLSLLISSSVFAVGIKLPEPSIPPVVDNSVENVAWEMPRPIVPPAQNTGGLANLSEEAVQALKEQYLESNGEVKQALKGTIQEEIGEAVSEL